MWERAALSLALQAEPDGPHGLSLEPPCTPVTLRPSALRSALAAASTHPTRLAPGGEEARGGGGPLPSSWWSRLAPNTVLFRRPPGAHLLPEEAGP